MISKIKMICPNGKTQSFFRYSPVTIPILIIPCPTKYAPANSCVFVEKSEDNVETIIPGYTHLQRAQPISFAFHLLAYVEMFEADKNRLKNILIEIEECPLGAGALAGSTLPLDRDFTAKELGFNRPTSNALNTVSDRDYLIDFLNACSIGMVHLSRLAEEIILWSSHR